MNTQKLTAVLIGIAMFPFPAIAAGAIVVDDTVAGIPVTIGVHDMPQGAYDIVVRESAAGPSGDIIVPVLVDASGSADALLRAGETEVAGSYLVQLEQDGKTLPVTGAFTIAPGPFDADMSAVVVYADSVIADGDDAVTVVARATDAYGNALKGRPLTLLSSRAADIIIPDTDETDANGEQSFTVSTTEEGSIYLRAMDTITGRMFAAGATLDAGAAWGIGNSDRVAMNNGGKTFYYAAQVSGGGGAGIIDHFGVTGPARVRANTPIGRVSIKALGADDRPVISYEGTVICASTDPQADLPEDIIFDGSNRGMRNLDVNFKLVTPGTQTIRCEDAQNPDIFGEYVVEVTGQGGGGPPTGSIILSEPKPDQWINTLEVHVTGEGPGFSNFLIDTCEEEGQGGQKKSAEPVEVGSNEQGHFTTNDPEYPTPLMLIEGQTDYTICIRSGEAFKSVTVHLDQVAPEIASINFAPETPREGENVLAVVETEPGAAVVLKFPRSRPPLPDIEMTEDSDGMYQAMFDAPPSGTYQVEVTVTDAATNSTTLRATLDVGIEGLPAVENLVATAKAGGKAELSWDPVDGATGYMIYVGKTENVWDEELETNKGGEGTALTDAEVAGIPAGAVRYFAVTALLHDGDDYVEGEKSNVARIQMPGMTLEATPQDSSVALKWSGLPKDLQVDSFLLQYGPAPDDMRETRTIAGKAQSQQVRDLINGVTYYFELTPITVAGVKVDELGAKADATPEGGVGFRPAPAEPIPFNVATQAPPTPTHGGAPLEDVGIPSFAWFALIVAGIGGTFYWHRRRSLKRTMLLLEQMARQYHS